MTKALADETPSVLGYAILQLFSRMSASGYDLKDRFQSSLGRGWHAYDTQIYRELKRLEANGLTTGEVARGRSGPQRRIYTITERGREVLREWLASPLEINKTKDEFLLRIYTLDLFPQGEAEAFLLRARQELRNQLQHEQAALRTLNESYGDAEGDAPDAIVGRQLGIELSSALTKARLKWIERTLKVMAARSVDAPAVQ